MADRDILKDAREAFKLASDAEDSNRALAKDDINFARLGGDHQWTVDGKDWAAERRAEGRPILTINMLPKFQRQVMNDIRQNRPAIKVRPVDSGADIKTADVYTGLIRNIEQQSHADTVWDTASEHAIAGGWGYAKVDVKYAYDDSFEQDIVLERVANQFSIYGDPYSQAADSCDWMSAFEVELVPEDQYSRRFRGAEKVSFDDADFQALTSPWREGKEVLVAKWWRREEITRTILKLSSGRVVAAEDYEKVNAETGVSQQDIDAGLGVTVTGSRKAPSYKVTCIVLSGKEVLKESTDWPGRYIPIIPVYGEDVNVDGKRVLKSLIRDARDPQMQLNFWRSYAAEAVALAPKTPFIGAVGSFDTDSRWETANSKNHPYLEYDPVAGGAPPQRQAYVGLEAGAMQQAMIANDDIKGTLGLFDASIGARSNETSGKAIQARQREGDVSTFHFADNLNRAIRHAGVIILDLIPKVYSGERMIRILGEDGKAQKVQIGRKPEQPMATGMPPEAPQMAPQMPQPGMAPMQAAEAALVGQEPQMPPDVFDLTAGKYDLVVQAGPSYTTRREETAAVLTDIMRALPQAVPVLGPIALKAMDVPGIEEVTEKLEQVAAQAQPQDPAKVKMAEMAAQLEGDKQKAQSDFMLAQQKMANDTKLAEQKATAEFALKKQQAEWDFQLEAWKVGQQCELADKTAQHEAGLAEKKNEREIAQANEKHAKTPQPDRDTATVMAEAVKQALSNIPPIKLEMPRMRRRPVRDQSGMIVESIDEPLDAPPPSGMVN